MNRDPYPIDLLVPEVFASARALAKTSNLGSVSYGSHDRLLFLVSLNPARTAQIERLLPKLDGVVGDPVTEALHTGYANVSAQLVELLPLLERAGAALEKAGEAELSREIERAVRTVRVPC